MLTYFEATVDAIDSELHFSVEHVLTSSGIHINCNILETICLLRVRKLRECLPVAPQSTPY